MPSTWKYLAQMRIQMTTHKEWQLHNSLLERPHFLQNQTNSYQTLRWNSGISQLLVVPCTDCAHNLIQAQKKTYVGEPTDGLIVSCG